MIQAGTSLFMAVPLLCCAAEYTTFIGDANPYQVARVVADSAGNTYIAGTRVLDQASDIFVMKLDTAGNTLFFRDISGKGSDVAADMAIDTAGNIYIGGSTSSVSFPVHTALQSTPGRGFLTKLNADASQLVWSTYFREAIRALAVDSSGNAYVTGSTNDPQFPVTPGLPNGKVGINIVPIISGAFLTKISAAGNSIIYSTVIAGMAENCGAGSSCFLSARNTSGVSVAVDAVGNAYLAGNTNTTDLPATTGAFLTTGVGAFVAKVKADGSGLSYLAYISATQYPLSPNANPANTATAIACDATGNAYLAGTTSDPSFPATKGAWQTTFNGPASLFPPTDAFALKLNPAGSALVWATYLGGSAADVTNAIALDASNQVWLAGTTASPDFPNAQGWSTGSDFVSSFDSTGAKLLYSARYPNDGASRAISVDSAGLLHVSGPSGIVSVIAPGKPPLPRVFGVANAANGPLDGRVAAGEVISLYGPHIGPPTPVMAVPDSNGNFPISLSGYQVIAGLPSAAPLSLLYVSDSQINAVLPFSFSASGSGPIRVITPNGTTPDFPPTVVPARPEIFHFSDGSAIALNQDGTLNGGDNPAPGGSTESIWMTGYGVLHEGNAGQIATTATNYVNYFCCGVEFYTILPPMSYAGTAPGSVLGISQINFRVPAFPAVVNSSGAAFSFRIIASDGSLSRPVTLYIRN